MVEGRDDRPGHAPGRHYPRAERTRRASTARTLTYSTSRRRSPRAMLSAERNAYMTKVGPGTPMGDLLRRFWLPLTLSEQLPEPDGDPVRLRLLGEDLVAFRDTNRQVGVVEAFCPHRRAPMFFGRNEECGLRCVYHGWKFDT